MRKQILSNLHGRSKLETKVFFTPSCVSSSTIYIFLSHVLGIREGFWKEVTCDMDAVCTADLSEHILLYWVLRTDNSPHVQESIGVCLYIPTITILALTCLLLKPENLAAHILSSLFLLFY